MRPVRLAILAFILPALTGCGTIHNLKDPPKGHGDFGVGECYPGGGVVRTGLVATFGVLNGVGKTKTGCCTMYGGDYPAGAREAGEGMLWALAGVGAWVDLPLSVVGDVITLPIAYARRKEYPWAIWWGAKSVRPTPAPPASIPPVDQSAIDSLNKPAD